MRTPAALDIGARDRRVGEEESGVIWFAAQCLDHGVQLERHVRYAEHLGDSELADFFRRAHSAIGQVQAWRSRSTRRRSPGLPSCRVDDIPTVETEPARC